MDKLSIVGIFYDGYEDLWYDFINLIFKFWPDCPYKFYIINNEKQLKDDCQYKDKITVLNAGKDAEYSKKIQMAAEQIESEYYLLLLEDFFISKKVSTKEVVEMLKYIYENNIEYYTMPLPEFVDVKEKEKVQDRKNTSYISTKREYLLSCQPSIWKREFLKLCIGKENYNAWIFEGIYAKTQFLRNDKFLELCVVDYNNILNLVHGAVQGKMLPKPIKILKNNGYNITTNREIVSPKKLLAHNIKGSGRKVFKILKLNKLKKLIKRDSVLDRYNTEISSMSKKVITEKAMNDYINNRLK